MICYFLVSDGTYTFIPQSLLTAAAEEGSEEYTAAEGDTSEIQHDFQSEGDPSWRYIIESEFRKYDSQILIIYMSE